MITGGNATVFLTNMDISVRFYVETLKLTQVNRFGDHWAAVRAGSSLTLGLHPKSEKWPALRTQGSIQIALEIDEPIEPAVQRLTAAGVRFVTAVERTPQGNFIHFEDPDGNALYLWETEKWG
jgi:predicted enzyme related to lactoylglutathione lyase